MSFNLYTFGCSFTNYFWPTWADILGKYADNYKNLAVSGSGNYYIFYTLIDFISKHEIKNNDIIAICWSSVYREDRLKDQKWIHSGPLFNSTSPIFNNESFFENLFDPIHYIERDKTFVIAAIELLEAKNIKYAMFGINDDLYFSSQKDKNFFINFIVKQFSKKYKNFVKNQTFNFDSKENFYSKYKDKLLVSMLSVIDEKNTDRALLKIKVGKEEKVVLDRYHPTPAEHLNYVENYLLPKLNLEITISDEHKKELYTITNELKDKKFIVRKS